MNDNGRYALVGFPGAAIRFMRAMEASRQRSADQHGLSGIEFRALFRIAEAGSVTPKQLADDLNVTNGAITGLSDRLITAGLIQREAHPNDRRSLHLTLSPEGHDTIRTVHAELNEMLDAASEGISENDMSVTAATLLQVTQAILES